MNNRQARIVELLRSDLRRDLYEGGNGGKKGSGYFYVSYSAYEDFDPLTRLEVEQLERDGTIMRKWPDVDGFYVLAATPIDKSEG